VAINDVSPLKAVRPDVIGN